MLHHVIRRAGSSKRPVVFLHGSGQDETSMEVLADRVAPDHPAILLRGAVMWEDGYAFFRRRPDRSLDLHDLAQQVASFQMFLAGLKRARSITRRPVLVGYSNGAIMAESLLRACPAAFAGAALIRPLSPDLRDTASDLSGKPALILAAAQDERRAQGDAELSRERLAVAGALVEYVESPVGHKLEDDEAYRLAAWISAHFPD
jgi:phospholipase/carboxylesterase